MDLFIHTRMYLHTFIGGGRVNALANIYDVKCIEIAMQMCKNVVFICRLLMAINHELNMRENRPRSRDMLAVLFRFLLLFSLCCGLQKNT